MTARTAKLLWTISFAFILLPLIGSPAAAQHFDPAHRHSVEISVGPSPMRTWARGEETTTLTEVLLSKGQRASTVKRVNVNLAYTFSMDERFSINALLNSSTLWYDVFQYPEAAGDGRYDFSASPISSKHEKEQSYALMTDLRWKWYCADYLQLYSALGLGCVFGEHACLRPYVAPIGINIGKKRVYGVAELNVSPAATFCLVGVGVRL